MNDPRELVEVSDRELVQLCMLDNNLFEHSFFPQTARLASPPMHDEIWRIIDAPNRYVNILMARGWAKTSKLRIYAGKRIAYLLSRTIVFVGASEKHTRRSVRWLRNQVERNSKFADTFQLKPGTPWTDEECQILHGIEEEQIWVTGVGITSSSGRGINFNDRRPDLIILDDVMNDENVNTPEGREKIADLIFGAFKESLAPRSESPFAKMVMLNTPQDYNDVSQQALKDKQFVSARFGCWTKETENLPLEFRESAWPELISSEELRDEYRAALARNRLSIFIREKECKLSTPENNCFKDEWLKFFGDNELEPEPPLHEMVTIMVIDPVPPPTEAKLQKGIIDGDYEAISVLGRYQGKVYLLDSVYHRGHDPSWTASEFFRLAARWRIRKALVESVAYQQTLVWLLREAMKKAQVFYLIEEFGRGDKRPKATKIVDGLQGITSNGQFFCRREQTEFISQYRDMSLVKKLVKDDVIETVALGCTELMNKGLNIPGSDQVGKLKYNEDEYESLGDYRGAP